MRYSEGFFIKKANGIKVQFYKCLINAQDRGNHSFGVKHIRLILNLPESRGISTLTRQLTSEASERGMYID
jgi:hypothetical protein